MRPRRDTITWRQIGTGYLLCALYLIPLALLRILPPGPPGDQTPKLAAGGILAAGYALYRLARPLLRAAAARWPGADPGRQRAARRGAVALLCLFSLGVTLFGAVVVGGRHG
jgi:hypothetical protein